LTKLTNLIYDILFNPFFLIRHALLKHIANNKEFIHGMVLDFGCGSMPYKSLFQYSNYIGVDIKISGHPQEDKKPTIYYDGKNLPFKNETFDSILCSEVFEHIFNLKEIIIELKRVLKANGTMLITTPFVWEEHEIPYDFVRFTSFGLKNILESQGFSIIKIEKTTTYIETILQLLILYITHLFYTKNGKINGVINAVFISPITVIAKILSKILPNDERFYNNVIIVCSKDFKN